MKDNTVFHVAGGGEKCWGKYRDDDVIKAENSHWPVAPAIFWARHRSYVLHRLDGPARIRTWGPPVLFSENGYSL